MKIGYLLSALLIVLVSISAIPAASAQTGWYFGVGTGEAETDVSLSDFSGLDDGSITSASLDDSDTGTKFFAGFRFSEKAAVEGAFVDLGEVSIDATSNGSGFLYAPGPVSFEADIDGINIALVGIWPVGDKVDVIGKLGFFMWDVEQSLSNSAFGSVSVDDDSTDLMFGVGGQFRIGKQVGIRVEFERFTDVSEEDIDLLSFSIFFTPRSPRVRTTPVSWPESKPAEIETSMPEVAPTPSVPEKPKPALPEAAAAARGDADAQYRLGHRYGTGQGVPKDDATAVSWYRKAAGQGHARAQYNLGAAYANGVGVIRNKETAAEWFFEAGQSFVKEGKRALALRVVDTIERLIPGHALASELLAAIRARFGF